MKDFLKQNKGIAGTDALIAILIISLFTGLIATILYNIYLSNTSLKRMTTANSHVVNILEYCDKLYYEDLTTTEKLIEKYNYLSEVQEVDSPEDNRLERIWKLQGTVDNGYNAQIVLDKYNPDENTFDLVRKITVKISYKVGNRNQEIAVSRIKTRENLEVPNKPDTSMFELQENQKIYAVKIINSNYVICTEDDSKWYNYDIENPTESVSAKIIIADSELSIGDTVSEDDYVIYQWVPRYVEDSEGNVIFLYSNTNSYVQTNEEGYSLLIESNIDASEMFQNNTGFWQEI